MEIEAVAILIVEAAIAVHRALGPGLLESAYQRCLIDERRKRGLQVEWEMVLPVTYDGHRIDAGYRIDMRVERRLILENKAVDHILPVHEAQLLTYLKLSGIKM